MTTYIRKTWRNILLLALAASLLAVAVWLLPERTQDANQDLMLPVSERISAIRIQHGDEKFLLQQAAADKQWTIVAGEQQQAADARKIQNLLNILHSPASQRYPAEEFDRAAVRLDPPMASITVNNDIMLHLGDYTGIEQQRYLQHEQNVYLVSPLLGYYIEQPAEFFIADADTQPSQD